MAVRVLPNLALSIYTLRLVSNFTDVITALGSRYVVNEIHNTFVQYIHERSLRSVNRCARTATYVTRFNYIKRIPALRRPINAKFTKLEELILGFVFRQS